MALRTVSLEVLLLLLLVGPFTSNGQEEVVTTTKTVTTTTVRCASYVGSCTSCNSHSCNYCLVSSMTLQDESDLTASQIAAQRAATNYACTLGSCSNLLQTRPSTVYVEHILSSECSSLSTSDDSSSVATTTTKASASGGSSSSDSTDSTDGSASYAGVADSEEVDADSWPNNWGAMHWAAVGVPPGLLISIACCMVWKWRFQEKNKSSRRVRPTKDGSYAEGDAYEEVAEAGGINFTQAGVLTPEQVQDMEEVVRDAIRSAKKSRQKAEPILVFGAANRLQRSHLSHLLGLVDRNPEVSVRLPLDWRGAGDKDVQALSNLLAKRSRVTLQGPRGRSSGQLKLPIDASCNALGDLSEALAVTNQSGVDSVSVEGTMGGVPECVIDLAPLRLTCQELVLSRRKVADEGCAIACGFVRPWVGRLIAVRMLECEIGDGGAMEIARLMLGKGSRFAHEGAAASSLRELVLSVNKIGDRGAAKIAEALPKCDSLQRLLLDRNFIGLPGAQALGRNLKRSAVRELVLGSHLGGNPLQPLGAEDLCEALRDGLDRAAADREARLEALNLERCDVGPKGAVAIAAALPMSGIRLLSLASDDIGDDGAEAILQALPPNILSLDLAGNSLTDQTGLLILNTLQERPSLSVSLAQNNLSGSMKASLREAFGQRIRV